MDPRPQFCSIRAQVVNFNNCNVSVCQNGVAEVIGPVDTQTQRTPGASAGPQRSPAGLGPVGRCDNHRHPVPAGPRVLGSVSSSPDGGDDLETETYELMVDFLMDFTGLGRPKNRREDLTSMRTVVEKVLENQRGGFTALMSALHLDDTEDDVSVVGSAARRLMSKSTPTWYLTAAVVGLGALVSQELKDKGRGDLVRSVAQQITSQLLTDQLLHNESWDGFFKFFQEFPPVSPRIISAAQLMGSLERVHEGAMPASRISDGGRSTAPPGPRRSVEVNREPAGDVHLRTTRIHDPGRTLWGRDVDLTDPAELWRIHDDQLFSARPEFVQRVSAPVLDQLLDRLFQHGIIDDEELESVQTEPVRVKKARGVIDMVQRKGPEASSFVVKTMCRLDPLLSNTLNLNPGPEP